MVKNESDVYTDKNHIKDLYKLMYHIHNIFIENGILYYVNGGTLMGAVRHGGIIPWDDDIDMEVGFQDIPKILSPQIKKEFSKVGYQVKDRRKTLGWIKIIKKGKGKHRPDADIFPVYIDKDSKGVSRTYWDFKVGEQEWPKCYFKLSSLFPLKEYKFGDIYVLGPKNPKPMLNRCYGRSWSKKGYITQDKEHMLLDEPILVKEGQFKPAKNFYKPPKSKPQIRLESGNPYLKGCITSFI